MINAVTAGSGVVEVTTDVQDAPPATVPVPVEHRWFGLDRRTFPPALAALAVSLVLIYGWQVLSSVIPWQDETGPGDVLDLGQGATAVPPVGWQLEAGTLVGSVPAASPTSLAVTLASGGATIELRGTAFAGSAAAFLDQAQRVDTDDPPAVDGARSTVTTDAGLVGVAQTYSSPSREGLDVAFKTAVGDAADAAPALLVRVRTAPGQLEQNRGEVQALLRTITPEVAR